MTLSSAKDEWFVGTAEANGQAVVVTARAELPPAEVFERFPWLTIVSWPYEPASGGMPNGAAYERMVELEDLLEQGIEVPGLALKTMSHTGNGLREWEFQTSDRDAFMDPVNATLGSKAPFPIQIRFYHDPSWSSLKKVLTAAGKI